MGCVTNSRSMLKDKKSSGRVGTAGEKINNTKVLVGGREPEFQSHELKPRSKTRQLITK